MKTAFVRVPLLACLGLLLCLASCQPAQEASRSGTASDAPSPAASENAASPAVSENAAAPAAFNEIAPPELHVPSTFMTGEDFIPMTEEQMMEYYGVDLPEEFLPGLALQPGSTAFIRMRRGASTSTRTPSGMNPRRETASPWPWARRPGAR